MRSFFQELSQDLCPDATSLHPWCDIKRPQIDVPLGNLLLNPANVLAIGHDDPDFVQLEKSSEVLLFAILIPPEQTFDEPTHRLEVQIACEGNIIVPCFTKLNIHGRILADDAKSQGSMSDMAMFQQLSQRPSLFLEDGIDC